MTAKRTIEVPDEIARHNYFWDYVQVLETLEMFRKTQMESWSRHCDREAMLEGYRAQVKAAEDSHRAARGYIEVLEKRMKQQSDESDRLVQDRTDAHQVIRGLMNYLEPAELDQPIESGLEALLEQARKVIR